MQLQGQPLLNLGSAATKQLLGTGRLPDKSAGRDTAVDAVGTAAAQL
jgi:hypothetical protein